MNSKVALVTGASKGLGKILAESLAKEGYFTYSGVRNLAEAPTETHPIYLDITKEEDRNNCLNRIINETGKIDVLIHNAGIAFYGAADSLTLQEAKELFEVNFFGIFRLTQLILPYMRAAQSGRILFISSIRGVESCAYMGMYSASKAALEALAFDWAVTLQKWNICVSVAQPGPMDTGIDLKHGSYFLNNDLDNPYLPYGNVTLEVQSAQQACEVIINHLKNPSPPFRFQTNEFSKAIVTKHMRDSSGVDWYEQQKTWMMNSSTKD